MKRKTVVDRLCVDTTAERIAMVRQAAAECMPIGPETMKIVFFIDYSRQQQKQ